MTPERPTMGTLSRVEWQTGAGRVLLLCGDDVHGTYQQRIIRAGEKHTLARLNRRRKWFTTHTIIVPKEKNA